MQLQPLHLASHVATIVSNCIHFDIIRGIPHEIWLAHAKVLSLLIQVGFSLRLQRVVRSLVAAGKDDSPEPTDTGHVQRSGLSFHRLSRKKNDKARVSALLVGVVVRWRAASIIFTSKRKLIALRCDFEFELWVHSM